MTATCCPVSQGRTDLRVVLPVPAVHDGLRAAVEHQGASRLTDARIFFSVATLVVVSVALVLCRAPRESAGPALQVLTVLPTAALPAGHRGRRHARRRLLAAGPGAGPAPPTRCGAGIVLGVVSAMKFTAWPLAALALFAARDRQGRRAPSACSRDAGGRRPGGGPFLVRNPHAFVQNVIQFPLGLAGVPHRPPARCPGHLLVTAFPYLHRILPLTVGRGRRGGLVRYLVGTRRAPPAQVCTSAGWVMTGGHPVRPGHPRRLPALPDQLLRLVVHAGPHRGALKPGSRGRGDRWRRPNAASPWPPEGRRDPAARRLGVALSWRRAPGRAGR